MIISESLLRATITIAIIIGLAVFIALLLLFIIKTIIKKQADNSLITVIVRECRLPLIFVILLTSIYSSYLVLISSDDKLISPLNGTEVFAENIWQVGLIIFITTLLARVGDRSIYWYVVNISKKTATKLDDNLLPIIRRILPLAIYSIGFLVSVDNLGISVSPILAGLGIGGLAVALAVQPTLSNFFAGTFVVTDGGLRPGDFIELDDGNSGYVESVGWRSTKIRSIYNNLVIIPNSKMADSVVTNYYSPTPAMNVLVECGVSYESNLKNVERFVLEEATSLINDSPLSIKHVPPFFGFSNFGDSNIDFFVYIQAIDRLSTFTLKSELIKKIHERFDRENIDINYPVRKIITDPVNNSNDFLR